MSAIEAAAPVTTPRPTGTFMKLRDNSWGIRLERTALNSTVMSGDDVLVRTRAGAIKTVTLGDLLNTNRVYRLFAIAPDAPPAPSPESEQNSVDDARAAESDPSPSGEIPTDRLHYDVPTRTFTGELSALCGLLSEMGRIGVRSVRTGKVVQFVLARTDRNRDSEITAYEYLSEGNTGFKLVILND